MSSISSTSSNALRITGMATGMDTDATVKQLMKAYQTKLDKMQQDEQYTQWKQDAYREIITSVTDFRNSYFDLLNKDNYMLSDNSYASFDITNLDATIATVAPGTTATAGAGAKSGSYKVEVTQLAKASTIKGGDISNDHIAVTNADNWKGKTIKFNVDGAATTVDIELDNITANPATVSDLVSAINNKLQSTSLNNRLSASVVDGKLQFNNLNGGTIKIDSTDIDTGVGAEVSLGKAIGKAINPAATTKLTDLIAGGSTTLKTSLSLNLTYNGTTKPITLDNTGGNKTINDLISAISSQTDGKVSASFSQLTGSFVLQTTDTGSATSISVNAASNADLLTALGTSVGSGSGQQDAIVKITPPAGGETTVTKPTNNFTVDGVSYNITKESTTNITIAQNTQKTFDKIKTFIDKYNELVDKIQNEVQEKQNKNYQPLTDEQKKAMSADDIKKWEEKAKQGIVRNDLSVQSMLNSMRSAFFDSVKDAGISLKDVGLNTSSDYTQGGKIILEKNKTTGEFKLKEAIDKYGDKISNIFMKRSTSYSVYNVDLTSTERQTRYNEEGIFQRINDIMQDYTTNSKNKSGHRGILVQKAGIKDTLSAIDNDLYKQITQKSKSITEFITKMNDKQNAYYQKFARLEQAMNQMNAQQNWLTQQLSK